jgi:hypothetical protein
MHEEPKKAIKIFSKNRLENLKTSKNIKTRSTVPTSLFFPPLRPSAPLVQVQKHLLAEERTRTKNTTTKRYAGPPT